MKFINFNNINLAHPAKQEVLLANNKQAFFDANKNLNLRLSLKQINDPKNYVSYDQFNTGHIYAEENECIIDVDTVEGSEKVLNIIMPFMTKICIEKSLRGYHFYIKLASEYNYKGKKNIKHSDCVIEFKGEGSYVYSSSPQGVLSYYYTLEYNTPNRLIPLTPEESESLMNQIFNTEGETQGGTLPKRVVSSASNANEVKLFSNKVLASFIKLSVKEDYINEEEFLKHFSLTLDYNPYKEPRFHGILSGKEGGIGRNNTLFAIMGSLLRCIDVENKELIHDFIELVNRDYCRPPLPRDQMNASFGLKRLAEMQNFTRNDSVVLAESDVDVEFYIDTSNDSPDKEAYYIIKIAHRNFQEFDPDMWRVELIPNTNKKYLIRQLNSSSKVIMKEILEEPALHKYLQINSKGAYTGIKWTEVPMLVIKNRYTRVIDPSLQVFSHNPIENRAVLNYGSSHYSEDVRNLFSIKDPLEEYPCPTLEEFMQIPFVRLAMTNLFGTKEKMALQLGEIYRCFNQKKNTNKVFAFLGSGGIGKDTWIDFLAHCFLKPSSNCYYKRSQSEFLQERFNMTASNASILFLNESGTGDPLSPKLLNKLNPYIGNNVMSSEAKFKEVESIKLHILTAAIASNNLTFEKGSYNNTRLILYVCPGEKPIRNSKENQDFFFYGLTEDEAFEKWSKPFLTFVLTNPYFYNLIKDKNFSEIDDSEFLEKSSRESSDCEELNEYYTITDELNNDSMDYIVTHKPHKAPKDWTSLEDQMNMLKNILYFNLFWRLGGDTDLLIRGNPTLRLMSAKSTNIKPDKHMHSRLYILGKYSNVLRRGKESSGLYCNVEELKAENAERLLKPLRHSSSPSKIRFSDKLVERYYIEGLEIKIKDEYKLDNT